jgi:hypothetical protein
MRRRDLLSAAAVALTGCGSRSRTASVPQAPFGGANHARTALRWIGFSE